MPQINPVLIRKNRNSVQSKKHPAISGELCKSLILCVIEEMANGSSFREDLRVWGSLTQQSPTLLAPGTGFVEDGFSMGGGGGFRW